jgi:hypothetical protein
MILARFIQRHRARNAAVRFARQILNAYWPDCSDIDGADVQAMGVISGIMVEVPGGYDPTVHGESDCAEPGDSWFVAHPGLKQAALDRFIDGTRQQRDRWRRRHAKR